MPNVYSYKTCINCGFSKRSNGAKYCGNKCQNEFQRKEKVKKWLSGEIDGVKGKAEVADYVKQYVIELRGHQCEKCKNSMWMGEVIALALHHIDGNFRNNKLDNLQLLCGNCHIQTPNYGNRNKGQGRPRYERYNFDATATSDGSSIPP